MKKYLRQFLALSLAATLIGCASQKQMAMNGSEPAPPAEGPAMERAQAEHADQKAARDMVPQAITPVF